MKSFFDKLNLRPQERRMVVIVGIVIFIVINVVFVRPIFGEYGRTMNDMSKAQQQLNRYQTEINKKPQYERQLQELESSGSFVAQEEQASKLMGDVTSQAALSGVTVTRYDPTPRGAQRKNQFVFRGANHEHQREHGRKGAHRFPLQPRQWRLAGPRPNFEFES